uniref:Desulfoferrodoxin N-terminal domain-containing protein n=1 Tax=Desulfatirhabdium butyrativorans TaxID=340467 RepID=A0A7C4RT17_9BACT
MAKLTYHCEACKQKTMVESDATAPECCGNPMKPVDPLPVCEMAVSPEHSRLDGGDPCDDGRAG